MGRDFNPRRTLSFQVRIQFDYRELGDHLRTDLNLLHKELLTNVKIFSSSELRVIATAETFCQALLDQPTIPSDLVKITKEMLDDSNAAKEQMDEVKRRLQAILDPEHPARCPPEFKMPLDMTEYSF